MASQTQLMPTGSFARNQTVTTVEQFAELSNRVAGLAAEIGSLREQRQSMSTFERLRDALLRHYPTPPCKPPSVCRLEAQEFRGVAEGIYFLEHAPSGAAFHWTGPGHVTRFSLFVDRGVPVCVHLSLYLAGRLSESDTMSAEIDVFAIRSPAAGRLANLLPARCPRAPAPGRPTCICMCRWSSRRMAGRAITAGWAWRSAASRWPRRTEPRARLRPYRAA